MLKPNACFQIAQLDEVKIRLSALRAIIDLLLLFGFQLLSEAAAPQTAPSSQSPDRKEEDTRLTEKADVPEDNAQSILVMLSEFLDSEVRVKPRNFQLSVSAKHLETVVLCPPLFRCLTCGQRRQRAWPS